MQSLGQQLGQPVMNGYHSNQQPRFNGMPPPMNSNQMNQPGMPTSLGLSRMVQGQVGMPPMPQGQMGMPSMPQGQMGMPPMPQGQMGMPPMPQGQMGMPPMPQGQMGMPPMPQEQMGMPHMPQGQMGMLPMPKAQMGIPPLPQAQMGMHPLPQAQMGMPPLSQGQMGAYPPGQPPRQKLDPNMMPSVIQVIEDDRTARSGLFPTGYPVAEMPPLVTTDFFAQDQGNSNPKFIRSTLYAIPQSEGMAKQTQLPFSVAITPIAKLRKEEYPPPIIDLGEMGPVRCQRCKAYMCPFMEFIDGGRKFRCPFCGASSSVEDAYFAHLDHTGRRTDIQHRPELFLGSYEFVATRQYCKNGVKPLEPAFIFMLDVSYNAIRNGLVELFCKNIRSMLANLPRDTNMEKSNLKIGFATYDQTVHFYNLSNKTSRPEMLIVNDVTDIFVPFVDGFFVDIEEAEVALVNCLNEIMKNFADTRITETMLGPVIQAGVDALRSSDRSGKLFIFHTSLPTYEAPGKLKNREDRKLLGTDKERTILEPGIDFYTKLGQDCVRVGCAVDLFLFPNSFIDIASICPVSNVSGGTVYKYQYFDAERDGARFLADLQHSISRDIIFDVMMRVRTSTGVRPTGFYGSFFMQNTTDIEVGAMDSDKSIQVEIKYDDKLDEKLPVYIQAATLFTSCSGQRRLRIHNLCLSVTTDFNQLYRMTDQDTIVTHMFKLAEKLLRDKSPKDMREEMSLKCANILATYRDKCSEQAPMGQLILPEILKLLPLYTNSMIKNDSLSGVDDRSWMQQLVPSLRVEDAIRILYPQILPISDLSLENPNDSLQLPPAVRASYEYFNQEEVYIIENGLVAFIWIGLSVKNEWVQDVFNANNVAQLDTEKQDLPERDNPRSRAVRQLFDAIKLDRSRIPKLFIIKQGDGLESWMKKFLVEDRYASNNLSYVDFLCQIHREIRNILS